MMTKFLSAGTAPPSTASEGRNETLSARFVFPSLFFIIYYYYVEIHRCPGNGDNLSYISFSPDSTSVLNFRLYCCVVMRWFGFLRTSPSKSPDKTGRQPFLLVLKSYTTTCLFVKPHILASKLTIYCKKWVRNHRHCTPITLLEPHRGKRLVAFPEP